MNLLWLDGLFFWRMAQNEIRRDLPALRQRRFELQQHILELRAQMHMAATGAISQPMLLESIQAKQSELTELDYVIDYFQMQSSYQWSTFNRSMFAFMTTIVIILTFIAFWQVFT